MYLPNEPDYDADKDVEKPTKRILPVTMRINAPAKYRVKNGRALVALLRGLQKIEPITYIAPICQSFDKEKIIHPNQILPDEDSLSYYMEDLTTNKYKLYSVRSYIATSLDLDEYKKDQELIDYLSSESISLEYNDLDTVLPPNIGFLENTIARSDTAKLHKERIRSMLPKDAPRFSLAIQTLHGPDHSSTRVFMITCDKKYLLTLTKLLIDLQDDHCKFFPWNEFICLSPGQKLTVINDQVQYTTVFRSLILKGFCDHDDDIPMQLQDSNDMDTTSLPLENVTVTDYLRYHVKSSKGSNLFEYVFPTYTTDTRELLVRLDCLGEAASYLEVARGQSKIRNNPNGSHSFVLSM
jgi:hypothetical protein